MATSKSIQRRLAIQRNTIRQTAAETEQQRAAAELEGLRIFRKVLNAHGEARLRELELAAGVDTEAEDAAARALARVWVVTTAKATSELCDVCFACTPAELVNTILGGLRATEIVGMFADGGDARKVATRELRTAGARLTAAADAAVDARD